MTCKQEHLRQMPGSHRRPDDGPRRPARLCADAPGPRAAHPPRQGDLQHLHQPDAAGARRRRSTSSLMGPTGLRRRRAARTANAVSVADADRALDGYQPRSTTARSSTSSLSTLPSDRETLRQRLWRSVASSAATAGRELSRASRTACVLCATERTTDAEIDRLGTGALPDWRRR